MYLLILHTFTYLIVSYYCNKENCILFFFLIIALTSTYVLIHIVLNEKQSNFILNDLLKRYKNIALTRKIEYLFNIK